MVHKRDETRLAINAYLNIRILCRASGEDHRVALLLRNVAIAWILHNVNDVIAEIGSLHGHASHILFLGRTCLLLHFRCPGANGYQQAKRCQKDFLVSHIIVFV